MYVSHTHTHMQAAALSQKLKAVMIEYNQLEEQHREKCKKVIKRQLQTGKHIMSPSRLIFIKYYNSGSFTESI